MRSVYRFVKSTLIGGLVILVPLAVVLALVGWAIDVTRKAVVPVFEYLPDKSIGGVSLVVLFAIVGLVAICFVTGLFAQSALIRFVHDRAERFALRFVPGYALMKSVGVNLVGVEDKRPVKTVIVKFPSSWQFGFLMETLVDGRHVVFVPGVPRTSEGTLHIVETDLVQVLAMPVSSALDVLEQLGIGVCKVWPKEQSPPAPLESKGTPPR
jgi:uncharacterized membrane protein